ncbi:nuclear transport factor 2 family protein [Streptomyces sp. NPDC053048]|uniref:nuclear transport factor 2 family protein n=1 Tax=Streptomyces sp. NPDC053048 TaxID=3365694 RepID=UPI0037CD786C
MTTPTDHIAISTHVSTHVSALISGLFLELDKREFAPDWARSYFTDDTRMVTPIGIVEGIEAVRQHTEEAIGRFARTQHTASDVLVRHDATTGRTTVSWNALMTHVHLDSTLQARGADANPLFTVGGRYEAELIDTPDGRRLRHVTVDAIWTTGEPPVLPVGALRI